MFDWRKDFQGVFCFGVLRRKLWRLTLQTLQCLDFFLKLVRHKSGGIKPSRQIPSLFSLARFSWLERNSSGSLLVSAHPWLTSQMLRFSFFSRQFACSGFLSVFCRSEISVQWTGPESNLIFNASQADFPQDHCLLLSLHVALWAMIWMPWSESSFPCNSINPLSGIVSAFPDSSAAADWTAIKRKSPNRDR